MSDEPSDDFTPLTSVDHWLGWLGDDPAQALRDSVEQCLRSQVPEAKINWIRLTKTPHFLTGGRRSPDDDNKVIVTRAGLAAPFVLEVQDENGAETLEGSFSWVASGLDVSDGRKDRVFLDLGPDVEQAEQALQARIYAVDDA